jgi:thymidine kinase
MGSLITIVGPMFAGKSYELIRRAKSFEVSGFAVDYFKPDTDTRQNKIASRIGSNVDCQNLSTFETVEYYDKIFLKAGHVIAIDEVQFFHSYFASVIEHWMDQGKTFVVAGLSRSSDQSKFGVMPELLWRSDEIIQLKSVCSVCKMQDSGTRTVRKVDAPKGQILIGSNQYMTLCSKCYKEFSQ